MLEQLSQAMAAQKRVHLVYAGAERSETTARDVDPYGLYQSGGAWFLCGHCHLRGALRTFHLARIRSIAVNRSQPRSRDFQVPRDFALAELATREAWEYAVHPPEKARVRLDGPVSVEERASFGPRAAFREEGGGVLVELEVTNGEALLRHVLALGDRAELLSPAKLRRRARAALQGLARRRA